jgi:NhaP-type Na+/H+ or K+/H+ antiporter
MTAAIIFLALGVVLIIAAIVGSIVKRLPLTTSLFYLGAGILLGDSGVGLVSIDPFEQSAWIERLAEIAVIVSLFAAGLKLRTPLTNRRWRTPVLLATVAMTLTVLFIAVLGVYGLGLGIGAAVLLGGVLAPTDPVLASDVQVEDPTDVDRLRFSLTGEAGLNDGTAFPYVMLGLGLLGLHPLGEYGWRWFAVDVVWSVVSGIAVGWGAAWLVTHVMLWMRREKREGVGLDDLLAVGLIAAAYGGALLVHGYGFLAVFAAGLAIRREERSNTIASRGGDEVPDDVRAAARAGETTEIATEIATDPETAPAYLAEAALGFAERLERLLEITLLVILGTMLSSRTIDPSAWWFVLTLFFVVRPLSVLLGVPMGGETMRRRLIMYFGIRGIGSLYYLFYAIQHGFVGSEADYLVDLTFTVIAASAVLHGMTVTPLMNRYGAMARSEARR